ncbi:MAG: hypothetical protein ACI83D_000098 [Planctomycetota bacterium]|jgi:hypothetical protein
MKFLKVLILLTMTIFISICMYAYLSNNTQIVLIDGNTEDRIDVIVFSINMLAICFAMLMLKTKKTTT